MLLKCLKRGDLFVLLDDIDMVYQFIQRTIDGANVEVIYIPTHENPVSQQFRFLDSESEVKKVELQIIPE